MDHFLTESPDVLWLFVFIDGIPLVAAGLLSLALSLTARFLLMDSVVILAGALSATLAADLWIQGEKTGVEIPKSN